MESRVPGWTYRRSREIAILMPGLLIILVLAGILIWPSWWWIVLLGILSIVMGFILWFFRDPDREIDSQTNVFYSPGDGVVSDLELVHENEYLHVPFMRIGIFLSVYDVHVQRVPMTGSVVFVEYQPGKNLPAFDPGASAENEQLVMGLETKHGKIIIKQIAGILARRCINYAQAGEEIFVGQRFGLIKFGSRVELYLPTDARIMCAVGDQVYGGISVLAEMETQ